MNDGGLELDEDSKAILSRTATGAGWAVGWRLATRVIGFCSTLILVRLLTPEDFGVVSLAIGFFQMLDQVAGFGVEGAIIRADRVDRAIYDSAFTINVVRGLLTSIVLVAAAVPVGQFFGNPKLVDLIYVLAISWAVSAFQNVGIVEFRRRLAFDKEFKIQIIPRVLSLAITLPAAMIWHSYWALVGGIVATKLLSVVLSYTMHPYRPWFGVAGMKYIFGFSFWEWIIGLCNLVGYRADTLIIGRLLGAAAVGVYSVGCEIASLPNTEIVAPLCRALFSGFVAERREGSDGSDTLLRVLSMLALLIFPLSVGLSLMAYPIVKLGFGNEWLNAVPLLQLLGVSATIGLFNAVGETLFSAHAWLRTLLWLTMLSTGLRLLLLLLLIPYYGLIGGAMAGVAMGIFQEAIYLGTTMRRTNLRFRMVCASVARPIIAVTVMAAVLVWAGFGWTSLNGSPVEMGVSLVEAIGLGAAVYGASLIGQWFVLGRPTGAESDMLLLLNRILRRS